MHIASVQTDSESRATERGRPMRYRLFAPALALLVLIAGPAAAVEADRPQELIDEAKIAVSVLARDENMGDDVKSAIRRAHAVIIVPSLIKGGFILGGGGGSGVMLVRTDAGWSAPAFVTMGEASIGLQLGASISEVLFTVMTEKGKAAMLDDKVRFGADIEAVAGPVGASRGAGSTTELAADIFTYAAGQGLFIGGAFESAYFEKRDDWNTLYYGQNVSAEQIVADPAITNPGADALRAALAGL